MSVYTITSTCKSIIKLTAWQEENKICMQLSNPKTMNDLLICTINLMKC